MEYAPKEVEDSGIQYKRELPISTAKSLGYSVSDLVQSQQNEMMMHAAFQQAAKSALQMSYKQDNDGVSTINPQISNLQMPFTPNVQHTVDANVLNFHQNSNITENNATVTSVAQPQILFNPSNTITQQNENDVNLKDQQHRKVDISATVIPQSNNIGQVEHKRNESTVPNNINNANSVLQLVYQQQDLHGQHQHQQQQHSQLQQHLGNIEQLGLSQIEQAVTSHQLQHQTSSHQNSYIEYVQSTSDDTTGTKMTTLSSNENKDVVLERIGKLVESAKDQAGSVGSDVQVVLQKEDSPDGQQLIIVKVVEDLGQNVNLANFLDAICLGGFSTESEVVDHMKNSCRQHVENNKNAENESKPIPLNCGICHKLFCSEVIIEIHKSNMHGDPHQTKVIGQQPNPNIPSKFLLSDDPERKFMCERCQKTFKTRKDVYQHGRHVHGGVPRKKQKYDCNSCSRFFRTRRALFAHELLEHGAEGGHQCPQCEKKFAFDDKLKRHVDAVHLKIMTHKCEECTKGFSDSYALKVHMERVHIRKGEFGCEHCEHRFNTRKALTHHFEQVHFDMKTFRCDACDIDFKKYQELVEHIEGHHGAAKEFHCKFCPMIFPSKPFRNLHLNFRHSTRKRCGYCGRYCKTQAALDAHVKSYHEIPAGQAPKTRNISRNVSRHVSKNVSKKRRRGKSSKRSVEVQVEDTSEDVVDASDNEETMEEDGAEVEYDESSQVNAGTQTTTEDQLPPLGEKEDGKSTSATQETDDTQTKLKDRETVSSPSTDDKSIENVEVKDEIDTNKSSCEATKQVQSPPEKKSYPSRKRAKLS